MGQCLMSTVTELN